MHPLRRSRGAPLAAAIPALAAPRIGRGTLLAALAFLCLFALSYYRSDLVDDLYGRFAGCEDCLDASVWANDAMLVGAYAALLGVSRLFSNRAARIALAAVAFIGITAFALDILVFRLLAQRLLLADVLHFAGESGTLLSVLKPLLASLEGPALLAGLAFAVAAGTAAVAWGRASRRAALGFAGVALLLVGCSWPVPRAEYLHQLAFQNVWQVNRAVDPTRAYSERFHAMMGRDPGPALACEPGQERRPNVIVLVVEGLSAYHSRLFSGLNDYTPAMDALAREGTWFSHFDANAFSTEGGLIALLTGVVPIPTAGRYGSTMAFTRVKDDLHRWLEKKGYATAFFTSGTLGFGDRDLWLRTIGIGYAEGASHPFYAGMPRGPFGAASDEALFDRFLQWHAQQAKKPFMATILTVATHPPFVAAEGGVEAKFRRVDRDVARFVSRLRERRFFDDGMLVVVGDHRAMTPIGAAERARFGPHAPVRIMAFALGATGTVPGEEDEPLQQTDLVPSLRYVVGQHACRDEWQGRFLGGDAVGARFHLHADPLRRNELAVMDATGFHRLLLDGDDTRWLEAPRDPKDAARVADRVNRERMSRMVEFGYRPPR